MLKLNKITSGVFMKRIFIVCLALLMATVVGLNIAPTYATVGTNVILTDSEGNGYSDYSTLTSYISNNSYDEKLSEQLKRDVEVVNIIDVCFMDGTEKLYSLVGKVEEARETITVKVPITQTMKDREISIYTLNGESFEKLETTLEDDYIVYSTKTLEPIYLVSDVQNGLNAWMIVVACVVLLLLLALLLYYFKMRREMASSKVNPKNKEMEIEE